MMVMRTMMIMRTAQRIMIFKGTEDFLNDGHENLMMIMRTLNDGHESLVQLNDGHENLMMNMRT